MIHGAALPHDSPCPDATGVKINASEARAHKPINHATARIDVRAQVVAGDTGRLFDRDAEFSGQRMDTVEPSGNGALLHANSVGESLLRSEGRYRFFQSIEGSDFAHDE